MMSPPQCCNCGPQGVVSLGICRGLLCMKLELQSLLGCPTQAVTSKLSHASCKALPVCGNARHHLRGCKTQDTWLQWGVPHGMSQVVPTRSACCLHELCVPNSVPTVLSSTILNEDSSRNYWGHSDTHTDLCRMLRTHTCALFCTCIHAHTRCHRHTEAEH